MLLNIYRAWEKDHFSYKFLKSQYLNSKNMWQTKKIKEQLERLFNVKKSKMYQKLLKPFLAVIL